VLELRDSYAEVHILATDILLVHFPSMYEFKLCSVGIIMPLRNFALPYQLLIEYNTLHERKLYTRSMSQNSKQLLFQCIVSIVRVLILF
jgi:hypothetical protein